MPSSNSSQEHAKRKHIHVVCRTFFSKLCPLKVTWVNWIKILFNIIHWRHQEIELQRKNIHIYIQFEFIWWSLDNATTIRLSCNYMYIPVYGSIIIFKFCRQFQYLALKWDSIIFFHVYLWDDFHRVCVSAYWDCKSACNGWQERIILQLNVVWCGFYYELVQAILISLHIFTFQSQQWELNSIKSASKYVLSQFMLIDLISVIINVSIND